MRKSKNKPKRKKKSKSILNIKICEVYEKKWVFTFPIVYYDIIIIIQKCNRCQNNVSEFQTKFSHFRMAGEKHMGLLKKDQTNQFVDKMEVSVN